ncbi:MAG: glycoside hydrolase family 28 protein [Clostridiales bacterium]|nr:glycoside hydrolase family 28 protein [Clostridiales bacterium]
MKTARSVTLELDDGGIYNTKEPYRILQNGEEVKRTDTVITSLYHLQPDTDYMILAEDLHGATLGSFAFRTDRESFTLDVREFGAKGDGESDDTVCIQAAIMACPREGRVRIPEGIYRITSIFLKSGVNIELEKGAHIRAFTDRSKFAIFPGAIRSICPDVPDACEPDVLADGKRGCPADVGQGSSCGTGRGYLNAAAGAAGSQELQLGTWEGDPQKMFTGIVTGVDVSDVTIYGEGSIDGAASHENWWKNEKVMVTAWRPRLLFLNHCKNVRVQGVLLHDSPSWTVHPYFCEQLLFSDFAIENPQVSPNTDGIDPESCRDVTICGIRFTLGDDCIAVKSGKIYMGRKYKTPSSNIHIYQCLMENGHGAVTVGSEMAGGVNGLVVEKCRFSHTDRGLRIKTRRGRGKDAVLDNIIFRDLEMDQVMSPFTANAFYFCDPDGRTEFVRSREKYPVDDGTPSMKRFFFENIHAKDCHVAALWFEGLPEQKIEQIQMRNIEISFAADAKSDVPIMSEGVDACSKKGVFVRNVKRLVLDNVKIEGCEGELFELHDVDEVIH